MLYTLAKMMTTGNQDIEKHEEFKAFASGLNYVFPDGTSFANVRYKVSCSFQC